MSETRPNPDALLARVRTEETQSRRGRLKIFFGMCAGVGKTYAMLHEAQERRRSGVDVVAGYIETHKRPETNALKEGLEELAPRQIQYHGVTLREFDLDAALARKPALILVDELAHTNAEGLRHAKRYQDVLELLDAGIDVYSTVNVQHIESLNDVVARITGIPVRETIPDSIIERADEIELVDIPPDDLLQRLHEGRIYVPEQVKHAVDQFFRRENLVALRELALRETTARVAAQVQVERAGKGESRPWVTSERILVCVGPSPLSARVIRVARRMAAANQAEWMALNVEKPGQSELSLVQSRRNLKLAERLGAEPVTISGDRVVDEILAYAVRHNITKIVAGKPALPRWREWLHGSIVDELIRRSGEIDIHVVKGEADETPARKLKKTTRPTNWKGYLWATATMAVCTLLAVIAFPYLSAVNLTMIYLAGVVFVATRHATGPSVLSAVLAALLFNFIFIPPYYSFAISDTQYIIAFAALLLTGLVVSGLAQRVRIQSEAARVRYLRTLALYFMSRKLAAIADSEGLAGFSARHIADVYGGDAAVLLPDSAGNLQVVAQHKAPVAESAKDRAAAHWVFEHQKWAGWSTETLSAAEAIYLPLVASGRSLGVLAFRPREAQQVLEPDQRHLLETFATQLAIALERSLFASQAQAARRAAESEQLRSSLLSSVSHDLRTPLAAITGSASTLLQNGTKLPVETQRDLIQSIYDEGIRLNQFVSKLLDMTRLESESLQLSRDWFPLEEIVGSALTRLESALREHTVRIDLQLDLPLLWVDGVLLEEVFVNLLENAARYTPRGSIIEINASQQDGVMRVEVADNGPGIEPSSQNSIFEKFFRNRPRTDRSGTGLGLAICRAIILLHGGEIGVENRRVGGASFWFTIPMKVPQSSSPPGTPPEYIAPAGSRTVSERTE